MFQDDRMISILSAIVLMVAIGTVIQRADFVSGYFGEDAEIVLNTDVVDARANRLLRIDVLKNDVGVSDADRERLAILNQPSCGRVFVQGQALQYLPDASCVGQHVIQYGIRGRDDVSGQVVAQMVPAPGSLVPKQQKSPQVASADQPKADSEPEGASPQIAVAKAEDTTPTAADAPALANVGNAPEATQEPSVIDTLIAGAAQPAQAAVSATLETESQSKAPADAAELATLELSDPKPKRAVAAPLGVPEAASGQSNVTSGVAAASVQRGTSGATVSQGQTPEGADVEPPRLALATPSIDVRTPDPQRGIAVSDRFDQAAINGSDKAPNRTTPEGSATAVESEADTGFLVAVVSRKEPNTTPPEGLRIAPTREVALKNAPVPADATSGAGDTRLALVQPLQSIALPNSGLDDALPSSPVDATQPAPVPTAVISSTLPRSKPALASTQDGTQPLNPSDAASLAPSGDRSAPETPAAPQTEQLAALPRHDAPCVVPPAMTIDVRRAARSIISIDAPCHADTIAELKYSSLRIAVPLDSKGRGKQMVLGFEPNAPAFLTFVNGEKIDFDLPFKGIGRVSRVALIWDMPVNLELNAIEFGAQTGSEFHIRPDNPRSFEDVRRSGGGFLDSYRSYAGIGQNAQIYTYYHRRGGQQGVVELMVDYASRNRDLLDGTCGDGQYAAPNFLVLRSEDARLERPIIRKLAALNCSSVAQEKGDKRLISGAVADLLIVQR